MPPFVTWVLIGLVLLGLVLAVLGKGDLFFNVVVAIALVMLLAGVP